jgi:hypothetical protein
VAASYLVVAVFLAACAKYAVPASEPAEPPGTYDGPPEPAGVSVLSAR